MTRYYAKFDESQVTVLNNAVNAMNNHADYLKSRIPIDHPVFGNITSIISRLQNEAMMLRFAMDSYGAAERGTPLSSVNPPNFYDSSIPPQNYKGNTDGQTNRPKPYAYIRGPGYEIDSGALNWGITAWLVRASARAESKYAYAGVDAYFGKAEFSAEAKFKFLDRVYEDGEWKLSLLQVGAKASASVALLEVNAEAGVGTDYIGVGINANGAICKAEAEAGLIISLGENGINAYATASAVAALAQGEARGTINFLGFQITGRVGGYAGAVGAEGTFGIKDGKFVMHGGLAALFGFSAGIEIGLNDTGFKHVVNAAKSVGNAVVGAANAVADTVTKVINDPIGTATQVGNAIGGAAVQAANAVGNAAVQAANAVGSAVTNTANAVGSAVKKVFAKW